MRQVSARGREAAHHSVTLVTVAQRGHVAQGLLYRFGMFEQAGLILQFLLLVLGQVGRFQLVEEKQIVVVSLFVFGLLCGELFQFVFQRSILTVLRLILRQGGMVGKGVEQLRLERAFGEREGLVLRMDIKNVRPQFFEKLQVCRRIVDERTALGTGEYLATKDEHIVIVGIVAGKQRLQAEVGNIERGLHHALAPLVREHLGVGPLTEKQSQGSKQDRLTCPRLAGDDHKAPGKRDVGFAYQRIVLNM